MRRKRQWHFPSTTDTAHETLLLSESSRLMQLLQCLSLFHPGESQFFTVNHSKTGPGVVWAWLGSYSRLCASRSGMDKGFSGFQEKECSLKSKKSMVGAGKLSAFVHCHPWPLVSIFTCESFSLLYTFAINIVAVTFCFVMSLLSKKNKLFLSQPVICLLCLVSVVF